MGDTTTTTSIVTINSERWFGSESLSLTEIGRLILRKGRGWWKIILSIGSGSMRIHGIIVVVVLEVFQPSVVISNCLTKE